MANPLVARRQTRRRKPAKCFVGTARECLGPIDHGCEIFGFSKGQFSLLDMLMVLVETAGNDCELTVSTWTAAKAQIDSAYTLLHDKRIKSLRWLVDFSFPNRQPAYCDRLRERFGDDSIRLTKNHAKFAIVKNADWSFAVRTSMNLNSNPRFEHFEISESPELVAFLEGIVDDVFEIQAPGLAFEQTPTERCADFDSFGVDVDAIGVDDGDLGVSLDADTAGGGLCFE